MTTFTDIILQDTNGNFFVPYGFIERLGDVQITSPTNGQAILYDAASGKWKNGTVSGGGSITVDQTYDPTSTNAQSGIAIANAGFITTSDLGNYVTLNTMQMMTAPKAITGTDVPWGTDQVQKNLFMAVSNSNTTPVVEWIGRSMFGANNLTFLMGTINGMAALGAHSWTSAKQGTGAAWADMYINPDGDKAVKIGGSPMVGRPSIMVIQNLGQTYTGTVKINRNPRLTSAAQYKDVACWDDNISKFNNDANYTSVYESTVSDWGFTKNAGTVTSVNNVSPDANGNVTLSIPAEVTENTVSGWGFIKSSALNGYATQTWVGQQGYLTSIPSTYLQNTATGITNLTVDGYATSDTYAYSTNVGKLSQVAEKGTALGYGAWATGERATALGSSAKATGYCSIQLGSWENSTNYSFGVGFADNYQHNYQLLDGTTGLIPDDRLNLKTVNGQTVKGSGNIIIPGINNLFDIKWSDHLLNDQSWLLSENSWCDGTVYSNAYNHLVQDIQDITAETETIAGYTVTFYRATDGHKICLAAQETTVSDIYTATGISWYYILDTTNTRFKVPRSKGGFVGARFDGTDVGDYVEPGLPNITGYFSAYTWLADYNGAFYSTKNATSNAAASGNASYVVAGIDASRSSSIYGNSDTVQPPATQMYLYFYVGEFSQTATEQTAGLNAELFNGKADTDLANTTNKLSNSFLSKLIPDYDNGISLSAASFPYTAPSAGYIYVEWFVSYYSGLTLYVDGKKVDFMRNAYNGDLNMSVRAFVNKGSVISLFGNDRNMETAVFYSLKGAN